MIPHGETEVDPADAVRGLLLFVERDQPPEPDRVVPLLDTGMVVGIVLEPGAAGRERVRASCRAAGVALFTTSPEAAGDVAADGVLLERAAQVESVRRQLGHDRLIGTRAAVSRHEAMVAGEAGADFIAFGTLEHPVTDRLTEVLTWWSELFVLPSLALAGPLDEAVAHRLAEAGADFLGVPLALVGADPARASALAAAFGVGARR